MKVYGTYANSILKNEKNSLVQNLLGKMKVHINVAVTIGKDIMKLI